jgi:hypothetical protein
MPGVATSAMAENQTKTDSIGLQLKVECWYEQQELPEAWSSSPFPLQLKHNPVTFHMCHISDHKNCRQKNPGKQRSDRLMCLDKAVVGQRGGGVPTIEHENCTKNVQLLTAKTFTQERELSFATNESNLNFRMCHI